MSYLISNENSIKMFLEENIFDGNNNFRPPSLDEEEILKVCLLLDKEKKDTGLIDKIDKNHVPVLFSIIDKLLSDSSRYSIKMSSASKHFICLLAKNENFILLYLASLQLYAFKEKIQNLDTKDICYAFSSGFLTDDCLNKSWNNQKISLTIAEVNLFDYKVPYKSIQNLNENN